MRKKELVFLCFQSLTPGALYRSKGRTMKQAPRTVSSRCRASLSNDPVAFALEIWPEAGSAQLHQKTRHVTNYQTLSPCPPVSRLVALFGVKAAHTRPSAREKLNTKSHEARNIYHSMRDPLLENHVRLLLFKILVSRQ